MKKLFISCPMRGLNKEEINEIREYMFKQACLVWPDEDFEIIDSVLDPEPEWQKNPSVKCLGRSIQLLADADYYIGFDDYRITDYYKGCEVETHVAYNYLEKDNIFVIYGPLLCIPLFRKLIRLKDYKNCTQVSYLHS